MEIEDPHGLAAQQAAARDYQPVHDSPMIGPKLPCENITVEYAKADPIYVEKTMALPQTYSHYRQVRGDGNCGWRAIGFSYFEKLAQIGDQAKTQRECARLKTYNQLLESVGGYKYEDVEDFVEPALDLLEELAAHNADPRSSLEMVHERWNDESTTNAIIYYLRLLAATYLKNNQAEYQGFLIDQGVEGYCMTVIEPVNREIDHLGITALFNVLLHPVGVVLEIAYLDRSQGATVDTHRQPDEANGQDASSLGPMVCLLYRPGHYDILYRADALENFGMPAGNTVYQVNRVELLPANLGVTATPADSGISQMDFGFLNNLLPNYFQVDTSASLGSSGLFAPEHGHWATGYESMAPAPSNVTNQSENSPNSSTPMTSGSSETTTGNMIHSPGLAQTSGPSASSSDCQIRFSNAQYEYDGHAEQYQVQTSTFKNSVYNTAHYRNPNFHPEECRPESEYAEKKPSGGRKKRRDS